ncbi:MAG: metallophosphoesterase family protein [Pseudomonadota bacterium]
MSVVFRDAYQSVKRGGGDALARSRGTLGRAKDKFVSFVKEIEEQTRPPAEERQAYAPAVVEEDDPISFEIPKGITARAPNGMRIYAVGDIHGRADLLRRLMKLIEEDAAEAPELRKVIVFVGDYVDRGFQSRDVIEYLASGVLDQYETHFLKGNHEQAFEMFLSDPTFGPEWARFGGSETLMSYGIQPPRSKTDKFGWEEVCAKLNQALPLEHRRFLNGLLMFKELGDYLFVHAGLRPGLSLAEQNERDFLWIREDFINDTGAFDRMIVHGHTPVTEPYRDYRRIGIDTGAYLTGKLTAAVLAADDVQFIST